MMNVDRPSIHAFAGGWSGRRHVLTLPELQNLLVDERKRLAEHSQQIATSYGQVSDSLILLRQQIFPQAFAKNERWLEEVPQSRQSIITPRYSFPDVVENNTATIVAALSNIRTIQVNVLPQGASVTIEQVRSVQQADRYLVEFVQRLYTENPPAIAGDTREGLAQAVRKNISGSFKNTISPYWTLMESLLADEYRVAIRTPAQSAVEDYESYQRSPYFYENQIRQLCVDQDMAFRKELIDWAVRELSITDEELAEQILKKYQGEPERPASGKTYRLREIGLRYMGQSRNLRRFVPFYEHIDLAFQPHSFWQELWDLIVRLVTGSSPDRKRREIRYTYIQSEDRIERVEVTLDQVRRNAENMATYLDRSRARLEQLTPDTTPVAEIQAELEQIVNTCSERLRDIYVQNLGLREWVARDRHRAFLDTIPVKLQQEFNGALLSLNQTIIINRESIRELEEKQRASNS
jgi:hypothetical protein